MTATYQHQALTAPLAVRPTPRDRDAMEYSVDDTVRPAYFRMDCERPMTTWQETILCELECDSASPSSH